MLVPGERNSLEVQVTVPQELSRNLIKHILAQVPVEVAPGLKRPGISVVLPEGVKLGWKTLLVDIGVNAEKLREVGFVLFKNFEPVEDPAQETWGSVSGDNKIQMIHRDHPRNNGVGYFYAPKASESERRAYTVVGDAETVFSYVQQFVRDRELHPQPESVLMELVQKTMNMPSLGYNSPSPDSKMNWGKYFFSRVGTSLHGITPEEMFALYNFVQRSTYRHKWSPGDLLLLSEDTMVHGRMPFALHQVATDARLTVRALSIKPDGRLGKL